MLRAQMKRARIELERLESEMNVLAAKHARLTHRLQQKTAEVEEQRTIINRSLFLPSGRAFA